MYSKRGGCSGKTPATATAGWQLHFHKVQLIIKPRVDVAVDLDGSRGWVLGFTPPRGPNKKHKY